MASYKEKNFIAGEKPQSKRPGKRNEPGHEYLDTLGSAKERVADWIDRGLPRDAAYSKVAIDEIIKEIKNTDDPERLEELGDAMRDVQMNQENSKWIKDRKRDYYGREPDPDEYIPEEEGDKLDYEVVNDKSIDAIKDNFTPPGAKGEEPTAYDLLELSEKVANEKDPIKKQALAGEYLQKRGGKQNALGEWEFEDEHGTYKPTESGRAVYSKLKDEIDTNDNGEIEVDEMADFQKSLDDYASKNKKGREDIPARYRK